MPSPDFICPLLLPETATTHAVSDLHSAGVVGRRDAARTHREFGDVRVGRRRGRAAVRRLHHLGAVAEARRFLQVADDLLAEHRQVARQARGDDVAVTDHGLIDVLAAGVDDVVLDQRDAGDVAVLGDARRRQHPAGVADRGDQRALIVHLADELDHRLVAAHAFGREAAGDHDRIEVRRIDVGDRDVRHDRIAELAGVGLPGGGTDHDDIGALFAQPQQRIPELELLILIFGHHRDLSVSEIHVRLLVSECRGDQSAGRD